MAEGKEVNSIEGSADGDGELLKVGDAEGLFVEGEAEGFTVGNPVVGAIVGISEGDLVGRQVGR